MHMLQGLPLDAIQQPSPGFIHGSGHNSIHMNDAHVEMHLGQEEEEKEEDVLVAADAASSKHDGDQSPSRYGCDLSGASSSMTCTPRTVEWAMGLAYVALCVALHGQGGALELAPLCMVVALDRRFHRGGAAECEHGAAGDNADATGANSSRIRPLLIGLSSVDLELVVGTLVGLRLARGHGDRPLLVETLLMSLWVALSAYDMLAAPTHNHHHPRQPGCAASLRATLHAHYYARMGLLGLALLLLDGGDASSRQPQAALAVPMLKGASFLALAFLDRGCRQPLMRYGVVLVCPHPVSALLAWLALAGAMATARGALTALWHAAMLSSMADGLPPSSSYGYSYQPPPLPAHSMPSSSHHHHHSVGVRPQPAIVIPVMSSLSRATLSSKPAVGPIDQLDVAEAFRLAKAQYRVD